MMKICMRMVFFSVLILNAVSLNLFGMGDVPDAIQEKRMIKKDVVTLFYIPFYQETYMPVMMVDIEKQANCVSYLEKNDFRVEELKSIFDWSDKFVRLRIAGFQKLGVYIGPADLQKPVMSMSTKQR